MADPGPTLEALHAQNQCVEAAAAQLQVIVTRYKDVWIRRPRTVTLDRLRELDTLLGTCQDTAHAKHWPITPVVWASWDNEVHAAMWRAWPAALRAPRSSALEDTLEADRAAMSACIAQLTPPRPDNVRACVHEYAQQWTAATTRCSAAEVEVPASADSPLHSISPP